MMESVIFGGLVGLVAVIMYALWVRKAINDRGGCPECGTPVPAFRTPTSFRQSIWGGWTCHGCGTELDRKGNRLAKV